MHGVNILLGTAPVCHRCGIQIFYAVRLARLILVLACNTVLTLCRTRTILVLSRGTCCASDPSCLAGELATRAQLARDSRTLFPMLEELARNARRALAVCLPRLVLKHARWAHLARHSSRLRHLLEELARNARGALALCRTRTTLVLSRSTYFACDPGILVGELSTRAHFARYW